MKKIEDAFLSYKKGEISRFEFKNKILEIIYLNKCYFQLNKIDKENLSDFLLEFLPHLDRLIDSFNPEKGSFSTFLCHFVKTVNKGYVYKKIKNKSNEAAYLDYTVNENLISIGENNIEYSSSDDNIDFKKLTKVKHGKFLSENEKILILVLKSCNYLGENHLEKISKNYNIPIKKLKNLVKEAQNTTSNQIEKRTKSFQNIISLYHRKNRYFYQLKYLDKDSVSYKKIQSSYLYTNLLWTKCTKKKPSKLVTPSNITISKLLNIPKHTVGLLLNEVGEKYGNNYEKIIS